MDLEAVKSSYRRWAPVYDRTFGRITRMGRERAVAVINRSQGRVLEVGVGTGLSLSNYAPHLDVTGIDYSEDMLDRARKRVAAEGLTQVRALRQMDARHLDFPDGHFDTVVAMYLVSVVPEPERVMAEIARVCKPGGQVIIVNHFARDEGWLAWLELRFAPLADRLGWHPDFARARIMGEPSLQVTEERRLAPLGLFTFLRLEKA
ncbi:class I SAM-dependent methyltransferase [Pararhodobacter sp. SW119]|uniref:class I SAM-dependent methyltransferase n=1 Tax=Pararhodobacter sp. SW119 TaxID=2780075 RepID=UPI001ADF7977|nr:class I SAM-dependent methyltransferase [Pararhodobacter sp. SW119]